MNYLKIFVVSLLMLALLVIAYSLGIGLINYRHEKYAEDDLLMFRMTVQAYQEEYNVEEDVARNKVLIDRNSNVKVVVIPQIPEKLNVKVD